ncbi:hypothetical protein ACQ4PT_052767 [Festuca glaucescens]
METDDDRLSALPDDLLHHLLSFLPSRRAVQTGVLSKRWTGLWCSVRRIDVKIDVDSRHYGDSYSKEKWEKAENFINNLLMLHFAPGSSPGCVPDRHRFKSQGSTSNHR